ncbi:hypothetical protein LTR62_002529 [Meristemomyces frigidus]|uniref:Mog1p/PsbP-like protein n=1 Tax=Meristemomyces frigidus TaxID=1508187 RepID=A0AAN7TFY6_9PEZI|nr:hypothetical protein LTR62_002529 [Meristemomyces frigidus]
MTSPQSEQYQSAALFGGAITCLLPIIYSDVSEIRQVPDTQEVWLDTEGFTSVVFDILERVDAPMTAGTGGNPDLAALKVHLEDIVGEEDMGRLKMVQEANVAVCAKMPPGTPVHTLVATAPAGEKMRGRTNEPDFVDLLLVVVRLEQQKTDLVVTINVPHVPGSYDPGSVDREGGKRGPLLERAWVMRTKVLESLEVRDWNLFGEE